MKDKAATLLSAWILSPRTNTSAAQAIAEFSVAQVHKINCGSGGLQLSTTAGVGARGWQRERRVGARRFFPFIMSSFAHTTVLQDKTPMRLLLVDDHALFRDSLATALLAQPGVESVDRAADVASAVEMVSSKNPDIVLLDYELGRERGIDFLRIVTDRGLKVRVLIVTASVTGSDVLALMQSGAAGVVSKEAPMQTLLNAVRTVDAGGIWLSEEHRKAMLNSGHQGVQFTDRERQVLRAVAEGRSNKEIASELQMSETSVKATLQRLFEKTGVRTRGSLVATVLQRMRHEL